ncbi:SDR family NAD(P)-dependent oxidoreductase [Luteibaculum oceani]|uniref:SDR family NAD(P)-dependent oxidoreductase n=1 Tax=Luteibaculum oceani TaxID=1294296 RepID=A0A5C6UYV3_9FLAO|nr:SDR family NAD(P)-dependent oxidoreductase [Luteibaculum oceani]TXC78477.1 SDR family NAD(P)-dependent oxidoreductase [Luteibaculum oceani]
MRKRTILITGATSGFGLALAKIASKGANRLIICGRRQERLEKLAKELADSCEVFTLCFDVQNEDLVKKAFSNLPDAWKNIDILINNAGLALGKGNLAEGEISDWDQMIDTNLKGILYVTKHLYPFLNKSGNGHIVNVGSIAGKEVYPGGNVYCASKHAVDAITKAMRQDFLKDQIRVSQVAPGAAETEFSLVRFKGDSDKAKTVYKGFNPLQAEDVANCIYFVINTPNHVCINDLVVMPSQQANSTTFNKYE